MPNRRRPQGDGMIRKRSDGRWEGRIIIGHKNDGTPMYKSVFGKTQKATLEQLHKLLDLYHGVDLTEECRMTLGEWLDKWLDEYMLFTIKERTLEGYRKMINNQIKPHIGNRQLAYLATADIQRFYNKIKKEGRLKVHPIHGKTLANSMVRDVHMVLHQALDVAVKERLIVRNPTNGTTIPKKIRTEKQVLNDEQLGIFLNAIKQEPYKPKIRKSGTGCIYQVNENLWEGSFYPRLPGGKRKKFNVYAKTREKCEKKLAKMIAEKKAEIAKMKQAQKNKRND